MTNSEGYLTIAFGEKYNKMAEALRDTLKANGDKRELFIVNEDVIDTSDPMWKDCKVNNEKYNCYPKITLNRYLPFKHNLFLDADMLCLSNTDHVWKYFKNQSQFIQHLGLPKNDKTFRQLWGGGKGRGLPDKEIKKVHGFQVPRIHGALTYLNKETLDPDFFKWMHEEMWWNYKKWTCGWMGRRAGKQNRSDQIMYTLAYGKFNLAPLPKFHQNFLTTLSYGRLKKRKHYKVHWRQRAHGPKSSIPIPFGHCGITRNKKHLENYHNLTARIIKEGKLT